MGHDGRDGYGQGHILRQYDTKLWYPLYVKYYNHCLASKVRGWHIGRRHLKSLFSQCCLSLCRFLLRICCITNCINREHSKRCIVNIVYIMLALTQCSGWFHYHHHGNAYGIKLNLVYTVLALTQCSGWHQESNGCLGGKRTAIDRGKAYFVSSDELL